MDAVLDSALSLPDNGDRVSTAEVLLRTVMADGHFVKTKPETHKINLGKVALMLAAGPAILAIYKALQAFKSPEVDALTDDVKEAEAIGVADLEAEPVETETPSIKKSVTDLVGTKVDESAAKITLVKPTGPKGGGSSLKLAVPQADVDAALRTVALQQGIDYSMLYALAGAESSFKHTAKASTSSATGLMQFTDDTWNGLVKKHKLPYTLQDRNDPVKAATVASFYVKSITELLKPIVGKPSAGDIYLAYFLGPSGAVKFLKALKGNPAALGSELFPSAAKANKNLFYGAQGPMTLAQTYEKLTGKVESYYTASMAPVTSTVKTVAVASSQSVPRQDEAPEASKPKVQIANASSSSQVPSPYQVGTAKPSPVALSPTASKPSPPVATKSAPASESNLAMLPPMSNPSNRQQRDYVRTKHGVLVSIPT